MPKILKRFFTADANSYVFQPAEELLVGPLPDPPPEPEPEPEQTEAQEAGGEEDAQEAEEEAEASEAEKELRYARIQAEAILRDARSEAEQWAAEQRAALKKELKQEREKARKEGFEQGHAEGAQAAAREERKRMDALVEEQIAAVQEFLEDAAREKARLLDSCREELKDLAVAIAEKVIRVSLKNSSDIILRMVDAATDTHKRCEWARIYVADSDLGGRAFTAPELTAALGHVSRRIRVVPMADDESGTCIVELPDVILDASVSTQLESIREVLAGITPDKD